jgi:ribosomal protein S14
MNACKQCGKPAKVLFCSCSCSAIFNNKGVAHNPRKPRKLLYTRTCVKCGNNFGKYKGDKHLSRKLCSKCFPIYSSKPELVVQRTIADYLNAKTATGDKQQKYTAIRYMARSKYKTDLKNPCQQCGYKHHVELAHIKSISSFPITATLNEVNAKENVAFLCPNCHWELDHELLKI